MLKNNIKHAACRWCYESIALNDFLTTSVGIGLQGIDLLTPAEWSLAQEKGLICSMATDDALCIEKGFNDTSLHDKLKDVYSQLIPKVAEAKIQNLICFSGNRNGLSEEQGFKNCVKGLSPVVKLAEAYGVNIVMELLNSKVDHPDYQCDHTEWGIKLCEALGSSRFGLLYDIYHMQIMEGDVIATIRKHHAHIKHYHTGGVPGRNEIDDSQELYYPAIIKAIIETGYSGFVAQEFVPTGDEPLNALAKAVEICDV